MQEWSFNNGHLRFNQFCVNSSHSGELTLEKCGNFLQSKGPFAMADQKVLGPQRSKRAAL